MCIQILHAVYQMIYCCGLWWMRLSSMSPSITRRASPRMASCRSLGSSIELNITGKGGGRFTIAAWRDCLVDGSESIWWKMALVGILCWLMVARPSLQGALSVGWIIVKAELRGQVVCFEKDNSWRCRCKMCVRFKKCGDYGITESAFVSWDSDRAGALNTLKHPIYK